MKKKRLSIVCELVKEDHQRKIRRFKISSADSKIRDLFDLLFDLSIQLGYTPKENKDIEPISREEDTGKGTMILCIDHRISP